LHSIIILLLFLEYLYLSQDMAEGAEQSLDDGDDDGDDDGGEGDDG
jgi:hypothetical protein